jgi:hypothetical protein
MTFKTVTTTIIVMADHTPNSLAETTHQDVILIVWAISVKSRSINKNNYKLHRGYLFVLHVRLKYNFTE